MAARTARRICWRWAGGARSASPGAGRQPSPARRSMTTCVRWSMTAAAFGTSSAPMPRTGCGSPTSPSTAPVRADSTCARSKTRSGRWLCGSQRPRQPVPQPQVRARFEPLRPVRIDGPGPVLGGDNAATEVGLRAGAERRSRPPLFGHPWRSPDRHRDLDQAHTPSTPPAGRPRVIAPIEFETIMTTPAIPAHNPTCSTLPRSSPVCHSTVALDSSRILSRERAVHLDTSRPGIRGFPDMLLKTKILDTRRRPGRHMVDPGPAQALTRSRKRVTEVKKPRPSSEGPTSSSTLCSGCGINPTTLPR